MNTLNESLLIGKDATQNYVSDSIYYLIGALMTVIMIFGFCANFVIIYTFGTNKKVRTVDNTLIIGLALSDIGQSIFGLPLVVAASFSKRWIFGGALCQYYAFVTTFFGIAQIATLTIIAVERYFVIVKSDRRLTSTPCRSVLMILFSFVYGSIWATGPLLGWSKYKQEDIGIACCVTWEVQDKLSLSYTLSICTFGWLIPLFLIAYGYTSIACTIYKERNRKLQIRSQTSINRSNRERKVATTILIMIGAFVVSWTPYSIVSLWTAVGDFYKIPIWIIVVPAVFAKCSIIWNPIIYVVRHDHFRKAVKQSMSCPKCLRFIFRKTLYFKTNFYNPCNRSLGISTNDHSLNSHHVHQTQYFLQNHMHTINKKGRSTSFRSYFQPSLTSGRQCRFKRHATVESFDELFHQDNNSSVDEHAGCLTQQQNDTYIEEYRELFEDSDSQSGDNEFDDNCVPDKLSKLVQTDTCKTYSRVLIVEPVNEDPQTRFALSVIERRLGNKWELEANRLHNSTTDIPEEDSRIYRNACFKEVLPQDEKQNGHIFKLRSSVKRSCSLYHRSLKENRNNISDLSVGTLNSARNLLKRQLETLYNAHCRSAQSQNASHSSLQEKIHTRKRSLGNTTLREVQITNDLCTANLPLTTRTDNISMNNQYGDDETALSIFTGPIQNFESNTTSNTQINEMFYLIHNNRQDLGGDRNTEPSSEVHLRQTTV